MLTSPASSLRTKFAMSIVWVVAAIFWLDISISKIIGLRAAHAPVSPLRYVLVLFWAGMLCSFALSMWRSWKSCRAARKVL